MGQIDCTQRQIEADVKGRAALVLALIHCFLGIFTTHTPQVNGFCFSASSAPWNVYPVESLSYSTGAEPIPSGSAKSKIANHFSAISASLCEITIHDFDPFRGGG